MIISHTFGVGDFIQAEGFFSDKDRANLKEIWYGSNDPQSTALRKLLEACPVYAGVKHCYLSYPTERKPGAVSSMANAGLWHLLHFTGSSFLRHTLTEVHQELPEKYDVIQANTSMNGKFVRNTRDILPEEWQPILKRLADRDTVGVVLDSSNEAEIPESDRLIDLRGKTTITEAVEILKKASGYTGIDSFLALLASQLFAPKDLLIRTKNLAIFAEPWLYYQPHAVVDFITPQIGKPRYPAVTRQDPDEGTLVELRCLANVGVNTYGYGCRVELEPERAADYIARNLAVPFALED